MPQVRVLSPRPISERSRLLQNNRLLSFYLIQKKINIGDIIVFQKEPELEIEMKVKVIDLLKYNTFKELFNDFNIEILADNSMTKQELLESLEEFYTTEKQKQYGVLGIRIEKI